MNQKTYTAKDFEKNFLEAESYVELINILGQFEFYFPFKNRKHDSWHLIFKKFSKILNTIYKNRFENYFHSIKFTNEEIAILTGIFNFLQRVQMFSNNTIEIPDKNLYLPFALSFEVNVSICAFKVISLFYYKYKILKNNQQLIEVLLKLVNIPGLKLKKSLYDRTYTVSNLNSNIYFNVNDKDNISIENNALNIKDNIEKCENIECFTNNYCNYVSEDALKYFNTNKKDKNITDLYLKTHSILCDKDHSFVIKTYALITLGSPAEGLENILKIIKKKVEKNNMDQFIGDETKYLLDEYVFYLLRIDFDKEIIKHVLQSDGFLKKRLKYTENSNFQCISIFSNISEIEFDVKYDLTSTVNNPDIDFQYFSGIYSLIKRDRDIFSKYLDLENYKELLNNFDILHKKKDSLVLKIIFKIINEVYKKSSAYFEPFEDSQYLKKCVSLIKDQSDKFACLCVKTITFFINHDPLSISVMKKVGVLNIFDNFRCSEEMNVALINLFDALSLDKEVKNSFSKSKALSYLLDDILLKQDSYFYDFSLHFSKLIKHHPEYFMESFDYLFLRLEQAPTAAFFQFVAGQELDRSDYKGWFEKDMLKCLDTLIYENYYKDKLWQDGFFKFFNSENISIVSFDRFIDYFAERVDCAYKEHNNLLIEFYLNLECHIIINRKDKYDSVIEKKMPKMSKLFDVLIHILPNVLENLKDDIIPDVIDIKDLYKEDVNTIIWLEINFVFEYIWHLEELYERGYCLSYFLKCIASEQIGSVKRFNSEKPVVKFHFTHLRFLKAIIQRVLPKFGSFNLHHFFNWIIGNNIMESKYVWSKAEICDVLVMLDIKHLTLSHNYKMKLVKFFYYNDVDNKILKFLDGIIEDESSVVVDYEYADLVKKIYMKYYTKGSLIKYKSILYDLDFAEKMIEEGNYNVFSGNFDICKYLMSGKFVENNEFLILCINTLKLLTFEKREKMDLDEARIKLIMKSKKLKRKLKMMYILSYMKYLKSQEEKVPNINRILKFVLKSISMKNKKNTNLLIKCIIHNIFDHSSDLLDLKTTTTPARFLSSNYLVGYQNIHFFRAQFSKKIYPGDETQKRSFFSNEQKKMFKKTIKKAENNILILNIITEIAFNNRKYIKSIPSKFILKIINKYVATVDLGFKISTDEDYYIALKFIVFCLRSKNIKLSEITQKMLIEHMCLARNHKIYNYLAILYSSIGVFWTVKSVFEIDTHEEDSSYALSEFYMKSGIANKLFTILKQVKEKDLKIINLSNNVAITDDQIMLYAWNSIYDTNKICFLYSFLSYLYDRQYDYLLDMHEDDESDYEDDDEDYDLEEVQNIPENVTPECSSENEEYEVLDEFEKPQKKKVFHSIYSAYVLCQKECEIMEKKNTYKFLDKISKIYEVEFHISNMHKEFYGEKPILKGEENNVLEETDDEIYFDDENRVRPPRITAFFRNGVMHYSGDPYSGGFESTPPMMPSSLEDEIEEQVEISDPEADYSISDESSIGEDNGVLPDISIEEINDMDEQTLDSFVKTWFNERKALSSSYWPIDKYFLNSLNDEARSKFMECESKLKDDFFLYAPDYESSVELDPPEKENIELYIQNTLYTEFLRSYISEDYTLQNEFSDFAEIVTFNAELRKITLEIINEKIYSIEYIKKCLQITKAMIPSSKQEIGSHIEFIKQIIRVSKIQDFHEEALFILSKLNVKGDFSEVLYDLSHVTKNILTQKSQLHLRTFCENNLKTRNLEFICILLDNPKCNLSLIIDLSTQFHKKILEEFKLQKKIYKLDFINLQASGSFNKHTSFSIKSDIYHKLDQATEILSIEYSYLTIFGLYEEFINWLSIYKTKNRKNIIEKYHKKRLQLEKLIFENRDILNTFVQTNDILIPFLSKFNVTNFTNKEKYLRSKMNFYKDGVFVVTVRRNTILNDSFFQVMRKSAKELKAKRIQIKFSGEQGLDFGGLTKEWLELVMKEALNPDRGLFIYSSDKKITMQPFKNSKINSDHLLYYRFIGRILAKVIIDGYNIGVHFDKSVYKYLLGIKCMLQDLEEIDPQYYKSLIWIRDNSIDNVIHLTFCVESKDLGVSEIINLIPNGENILVTDLNKNEYINLVVENKLIKSIQNQLNAIKKGIYEMIDEDMISIFNEKELELLICGVPDINVEDWQNNTEYHGYTKNSRNIIWFWKAVQGFTPDEKAKLLQFCTSSSRVPFEGFKMLQSTNGIQNFSIHKIATKRLPTAHTCFNQLDLPEYSSYEELRKNIIYAINECQGGFGII